MKQLGREATRGEKNKELREQGVDMHVNTEDLQRSGREVEKCGDRCQLTRSEGMCPGSELVAVIQKGQRGCWCIRRHTKEAEIPFANALVSLHSGERILEPWTL